jgi:hypothetical protein
MTNSLAGIFEPKPTRWGLRGDPMLWADMQMTLAGHPIPASQTDLITLLEQTFEALTGLPLTYPDPIYIQKYDTGGLSRGSVSPEFWQHEAMPYLVANYLAYTRKR